MSQRSAAVSLRSEPASTVSQPPQRAASSRKLCFIQNFNSLVPPSLPPSLPPPVPPVPPVPSRPSPPCCPPKEYVTRNELTPCYRARFDAKLLSHRNVESKHRRLALENELRTQAESRQRNAICDVCHVCAWCCSGVVRGNSPGSAPWL